MVFLSSLIIFFSTKVIINLSNKYFKIFIRKKDIQWINS
ncbi:hypothetical protein [Campylobacter phage CP81]|uniref:Uncharacterized protein n=1 Tax=Campylobacter phage CP81 TaxID=2927008 RepID=G0LWK4_9CAUD|nr:hypothetical protein FDJ37_gp029 [Campylobacter phage CP81]CBZ42196.1 hypothetical protein [Campylobacter phage CP81]